jgi:hypothetical protein
VISPITLKQFERLQERFTDAQLSELPSGALLVTVPSVAVPAGWSHRETPLWFIVPVGYPGPCPDCFWVRSDLRLQDGQMPQASGEHPTIPETSQPALWFSWHVVDQQANWNPARDTLSTYMSIVLHRLQHVQ